MPNCNKFAQNRLVFVVVIAFGCVFFACPAKYCAASSDDPGAQASRFMNDIERGREELEKKELKAPQIEVETPKEMPVQEGISFVLKEVVITGATLFTDEQLRPFYQGYLDREVTFADLENITKNIKAKYIDKGYATTVVYLPEQDISGGKVEIRVLEGRLGEVIIEGNKHFSWSLIRTYIHTRDGEILNLAYLQKDLLRLNKNPDLEVKTVITQGAQAGTTNIVLKVQERFPHHLSAMTDKQGSRLIGFYRGATSFRSTNLFGNNDNFYTNVLVSKSSVGTYESYIIPLDTYGAKAGLDVTTYRMRLLKDFEPLNIKGYTEIFTPHIIKELYLSERFQADVELGMEIKSIRKKIGGRKSSDDQLRLPYISFDMSRTDSFMGGGQTTFTPRFTVSLEDAFGASSNDHPSASRNGTGGAFGKYELVLRRTQKMPYGSYLSIRSQFQDASDSLPSSEQLQLGGVYSVRGYPEGDYMADRGASLSLDWVFPVYFIPEDFTLFAMDTPLRDQIKWLLIMDAGYGNLKETLPGEKSSKFLMGLGAGLHYNLHKNLFLRMEWAVPVGDEPAVGMGPSTFNMLFQYEI